MYEQLLCLKHYALTHPEVELHLFAATATRQKAFRELDLSFASEFAHWTSIEQSAIDTFLQFQVHDCELQDDVLSKLPQAVLAKLDRKRNLLPWVYMRDHKLIPESDRFRLPLGKNGNRALQEVSSANEISPDIWQRPTISFLWRYRVGAGAISSRGQKTQEEMVTSYSAMFRSLIERHDCHVLVCGMNVITNDTNRERTDNKYPAFGLDLPKDRVTYFKGLSWPLELELASRATVCCGHASGFTEGLWLKRGEGVVLMDAPPHYLAKAAYHRMPLFNLNRPWPLVQAALSNSTAAYEQKIEEFLTRSYIAEAYAEAA
ncbi:MAG: hypothetical protein NVSMB62_04290 [Acidobacteriaceae bacterium]